MEKGKRVYVGMSGGVDSSVSAALLKEAGYAVTGVFIKTWQPEFLTCNWRDERHDAMRVCAALDIPFKTLDLSEEYKRDVVDYMVDEYTRGRTPNPDSMCNRHIKFGAFFDFAMRDGADYVATGHYARIEKDPRTQTPQLLMGKDQNKDQSYFLWMVSASILERTLFPVGNLEKEAVREHAKRFGLHVADKKDSQGVCFLGEIDMRDFLKKFITTIPGHVLDTDGVVIGTHEGALLYTLGQRHGFTISTQSPDARRQYIVAKDTVRNTITVSDTYFETADFDRDMVSLQNVQWITDAPRAEKTYTARIRYRQKPQTCTITHTTDNSWSVHFETPQKGIAAGQSCVIYDGEMCVGGGVME